MSSDEIASTLFLTRHTVRDHLKAIFEKVGASRLGRPRAELIAGMRHRPARAANG